VAAVCRLCRRQLWDIRDAANYLAERASQPGELGARLMHRHELLEQAITKSRRGYEAVPLPVIEQFNAKYVALHREAEQMGWFDVS
jgi:hypothetical protein